MAEVQSKDMVITGLGIVSPVGIGIDCYWNALLTQSSGIRKFDSPLEALHPGGFGGILQDFDAKHYVRPRKSLKVMCREIQTSFSSAAMAIEQANLTTAAFPAERIGTVFGSEMMSGEPEELADTMLECGIRSGAPQVADFGAAAMRKVFPLWMLKYLPNMATCHVGITIGALGPNNTIVSGDTSGMAALSEAICVIQRGHADAIVCGGAGTRVSPTRLISAKIPPLAKQSTPLSTSSRPFSTGSDGIVGGEGAAAVVIETYSTARKRDVPVLARVESTAVRFVPSKPGEGPTEAISLAIRGALKNAGRSPEDVGAIVSQGSGFPPLDHSEAKGVLNALGNAPPFMAPIASQGHCGAASGSIALVTGALIAHHRVVPPSLNWDKVSPEFGIRLASKAEELQGACLLVLSHTREGHACAAVLSPPRHEAA